MIGILIGTAIVGIPAFIARTKNKKRITALESNQFFDEANAVMDKVRANTKIKNFVLFHDHNSGGPLVANSSWYSSIMDESTSESKYSFENWKRIPIHAAHRKVMVALHESPMVIQEVKDIERDVLQSKLIHLGLKGVMFFRVYAKTKNSFIYAMVITEGDPREYRWSADFSEIKLGVLSLSSICEKYHKFGVLV